MRTENENDYCHICGVRVGDGFKGGTVVMGSKVGSKTTCQDCIAKQAQEDLENNFKSLGKAR